LLTGLGSGFTSFVSQAGGPVAAVYLLSQGLNKTTYQATTVLAFWAVNVMKFAIYAWLGIFTVQTFATGALLARSRCWAPGWASWHTGGCRRGRSLR